MNKIPPRAPTPVAATASSAAIDLSPQAVGGRIHIERRNFIDADGRVLLLHGMNVSGANKLYVLLLWIPWEYMLTRV